MASDDGHSFVLAPALLWRPSRWLTLTAKQEDYRKRESPQVMQRPGYGRQKGPLPTPSAPNLDGVPVPGQPDDWNSMATTDYRASDTSSTSLVLDVKGDEHWNLRAGYARTRYAVDARFSGNFGMSNDFPFMQGRRLRRQSYTNWDDTFELNAAGKYDLGFASVRLLTGAQYVLRRFDTFTAQAPNDPALGPIGSPLPNWDLREPSTWNRTAPPPSSLDGTGTSTTYQYRDRAAFAGATLGFLQARLLLLAGARLIDEPLKAEKLTPQYGVLYKVSSGVSLLGTSAESFVPPTDAFPVRDGVSVRPLPTKGSGVDVGAKVELFGGRLTVTVFDVRNENIVNDILELDPTTGMQVFTRVQSGEQHCTGIELDATLTPVQKWQAYLAYSYNYARIAEFSHDAAILAGGPSTPGYKEAFLFHNAPLQMSAPHLASLWTRYDFAEGQLAGVYLAAGTNLVFEQALLPDTPASYRQTYALFNALAGYAHELQRLRLSAEIYGKNLTDRHYRPSQSSRSRPQEVGVALTVKD